MEGPKWGVHMVYKIKIHIKKGCKGADRKQIEFWKVIQKVSIEIDHLHLIQTIQIFNSFTFLEIYFFARSI